MKYLLFNAGSISLRFHSPQPCFIPFPSLFYLHFIPPSLISFSSQACFITTRAHFISLPGLFHSVPRSISFIFHYYQAHFITARPISFLFHSISRPVSFLSASLHFIPSLFHYSHDLFHSLPRPISFVFHFPKSHFITSLAYFLGLFGL
jgi:hypothetical protein